MKEIKIRVLINDLNEMVTIIKTTNLDKESIDGIALINLALENLKQQQLNKLGNLRKDENEIK